jgi:hypothetical protein
MRKKPSSAMLGGMDSAAFDGRATHQATERCAVVACDRRALSAHCPLEHDVVLEVAPHKTASLTAWLAGSWIAASVTGLGIVTVPATANRKAVLDEVVEGVRAWMLDEWDDTVSATYGSADLGVSLGATTGDRR